MRYLSLRRPGFVPNYYFACHFLFSGLVFTVLLNYRLIFLSVYMSSAACPISRFNFVRIYLISSCVPLPILFLFFPAALCISMRFFGLLSIPRSACRWR